MEMRPTIKGPKKYIPLFFLVFLSHDLFAQVQICEIVYGENNIVKARKKYKPKNNFKSNWKSSCYEIGKEFDNFQKPIKNKPIYACCKPQR